MIAWSDLLAAIALYLVLEGIMPFLNPAGMKRAFAIMTQIPDQQAAHSAGLGASSPGSFCS
jgi:uncharacterized protein YjeT (DUF2065 family)